MENGKKIERVQVNALTDGVGGSRTSLWFLSFAAAATFLLFRRQMLRAREERVTTDKAAATALQLLLFIVEAARTKNNHPSLRSETLGLREYVVTKIVHR